MDAPVDPVERLKAKLKMRLHELVEGAATGATSELQPRILKDHLHQMLRTLSPREHRLLHISRQSEEDQFIQQLLDDVFGSNPLERLLADETISEIMINGPREIFVERNGRIERLDLRFRNEHHLMAIVERLLDSIGLSVNESNPVCDARLPDGSRMNVITHPVVINGPVITIRRKAPIWTMHNYLATGALSQQAADFLEACVRAKVNLVLSGGTSTGKTTLLSVLSDAIPRDHRIITIENVAELELTNREHWIRLVGKAPNIEGRGEIPLRVLVRNALRMRPDRIILGEARGGEAIDVVQAMHTGHDGFITVLHGNSPQAALERLQTLMLMSGIDLPPVSCQMQIASAVDLVVHMARFIDGSRRIAAITQVLGVGDGNFKLEDLFVYDVQGFSEGGQISGTCRYTGARPKFLSKFRLNNVEVPSWVTT